MLATDDSKLSSAARENCVDPANVVHFSALSALEITIKHRLGRLRLPVPPHVYLASRRKWLGIEPLAFDEDCAAHDARLPPYHSDPFDRGLVAQAIVHGLTLVTPDPQIQAYPALTLS